MAYTKEQKSEYNKKYRQKMTEERREAKRSADREYYHANKEKCNERNLRYYENHKERIKENGAKNNKKRRENLREQAKQKLGGKCVWCATTENLEFDHIDPAQKTLTIGKLDCSLDLWWKEVEKCRLLCKTCHKKHSDAEMAAKHLYWINLPSDERQKLIQKQLDEQLRSDIIGEGYYDFPPFMFGPEDEKNFVEYKLTMNEHSQMLNLAKKSVTMSESTNHLWKYNEDKILKDIQDYVTSTYHGHYCGDTAGYADIQTIDLMAAKKLAAGFCQANILKYGSRYGDKDGRNKRDLLKVIHYAMLLLHFDGHYTRQDNGLTEFTR